ncbi:putative ABC transporter substrate-binding protein [Bacillus sp. TS-2]|nr:putative ABC transporter substrate-binding protein [Bacillus sp. TS-2]
MLRRTIFIFFLPIVLFIGCSNEVVQTKKEKVGLLLEDSIYDQGWNSKGYQGLLNIHTNLDVEVYSKEEVNTEEKIKSTIEEFYLNDVSIIFGHGQMYAHYFSEMADEYPDIHFISFNGHVKGNNVTSLHFDGYAMGYFAGSLSAIMSQNNKIAVIAAFPWQPEIEGFIEGAKFENEDINVKVEYVNSWTDEELALSYYQSLKNDEVDVFYPIGDGFHISVLEEVKNDGLYIIGYVSDFSDLGEATVLTSTIQHVDELYEIVTRKYLDGELDTGNLYFDFQDSVISLGKFGSQVSEGIVEYMEDAVIHYIENGEMQEERYQDSNLP